MTDCPNGNERDLLPELVAGTLAPDVRAGVEEHVAGCPDCRAEIALLEAIRRTYARPVAIDVARIAAALPAPREQARRRSFDASRWRAAAAIAMFAVGATSIWIVRQNGVGNTVSIDTIGTVVESAERAVTLGHRLGELSEQDLEALLGALDGIDALPALEPAALIAPLGGGEGS